MRTNRLTDAQREIPFMGIPFWVGQGFGLGLSVITDAEKQAWMGAGIERRVRLAGRLRHLVAGRSGRGHDPDLPDPELHAARPRSRRQLATGQRMGARLALPMFQKAVYAALGK